MIYQWLLAAITLILPSLAGIAITSKYKALREQTALLAVGGVLGISAYGTLAYAIAHLIPLTPPIIIGELLACLGIAAFMMGTGGWRNFSRARKDTVGYAILILCLILFSIIGSKLLIESQDGLQTGIINAYGDIGWHAAIIMHLAENQTLPIQDPIFAGERLTYPFLANLISATMVSIGSSLSASVDVPAIFLVPIILLLTYLFVQQYGKSSAAGIIGAILFLFGGATLGWIRVFSDIAESGASLWDFFLRLPAEDYSGVGTSTSGFHFLNPITSLLLPQRAMLFGMPIVLSVLLLIHPTVQKRNAALWIGGILAGFLPLFHAHACIALAAAIIGMFLASRAKKPWGMFFLPALAIGIPELLFYISGNALQESFFRYDPFWMADNYNKVAYWLKNTGLYIPLVILGLFIKAPKQAKIVAAAGIVLFLIANTFLFAPWAWDNFKLLVFWLLFSLPLIGYLAASVWTRYRLYAIRTIIVLILFAHTFAAMLDIAKLALPTAQTWMEWDNDAIAIARMIQQNVPRHAPIITAPVHNSPATLAGRLLFLGYPAHIWSHGISPWEREREIQTYMAGETETVHGIRPRYILIGPQEQSAFTPLVIRQSWQQLAFFGPYTLFSAY